jgi:hypothetical protein
MSAGPRSVAGSASAWRAIRRAVTPPNVSAGGVEDVGATGHIVLRGATQVAALTATLGRLRRLRADIECHTHRRYGGRCARCAPPGREGT